jgi:alpha,alpha-trehalase
MKQARKLLHDKMPQEVPAADLRGLQAILCDLEVIVPDTAAVHAEAWKRTFDEYLEARAAHRGCAFEPFDLSRDYTRYVDGKSCRDAVAGFLESRNVFLPRGSDSDPADKETVCGLANRKSRFFVAALREAGVRARPDAVALLRKAGAQGLKVAAVTAHRDAKEVLQAAGLAALFDAVVDGRVAQKWLLEEKPAPDTGLEAARRLGVPPSRAAVVEVSFEGVEAGRAGRFARVVGLDCSGRRELLRIGGADIVVADLGELRVDDGNLEPARMQPLALERLDEIKSRIGNRRMVVFLDYDGTLTPIVDRPDLAVLSEAMRATLEALADCCTVLIISGRERENVERLVALGNIVYAGCHGFDISGPAGTEIRHDEGRSYVPAIKRAADELQRRLAPIDGVLVEDKTYALAVHFRLVRPDEVPRIESVVDDVLAEQPRLCKTGGKKIFELRPNIDWDKGKAVLWLLDALGLDGAETVPFYLGDDETDRDAFRALQGKGISILVSEHEGPGEADYRLSDTERVREFLDALTAICRGNAQ